MLLYKRGKSGNQQRRVSVTFLLYSKVLLLYSRMYSHFQAYKTFAPAQKVYNVESHGDLAVVMYNKSTSQQKRSRSFSKPIGIHFQRCNLDERYGETDGRTDQIFHTLSNPFSWLFSIESDFDFHTFSEHSQFISKLLVTCRTHHMIVKLKLIQPNWTMTSWIHFNFRLLRVVQK
jgi:hypothetical protein